MPRARSAMQEKKQFTLVDDPGEKTDFLTFQLNCKQTKKHRGRVRSFFLDNAALVITTVAVMKLC